MNKQKQIDKAAAYWFACNKEGFTPNQKIDFEKWLNEDKENKKAYEDLNKIEALCQCLNEDYLENLMDEVQKGAKKTKIFEKLKTYAVAASFLIVIFAGFFQGFNYYFQPNYEKSFITKINPEKIILPDGSKLSIDAKTKIHVEFYKKQRLVNLIGGQVMFRVKKSKDRPFNIISNHTHIQVVGTTFEVKNLADITTVKVKEGVVKVSKINPYTQKLQTLKLLTKGEKIVLNKFGKVLNLSTTSVKDIALWENNQLIFDNTNIEEALKEFSKYTNKKIKLNNNKIAKLPVTGHFSTKQIEKFFKALSAIYPVKIEKKNNTIYINRIN
ncbi:FecR family protein [Halarcobacter anaerophilus]|uniref:Siderophore-interacting protein n=1 Tax=Halarcobacter anaerophilus TaxID=877500 RepID=A0A4Q0XXL9_9BACT|nr:FecR domain-containing protein [Halarcobacter anaerophilus]QDF28018.1 sigma factor regulatory protein, FecR family [Halarcobacter anaerophilus]RXJ61454.1 siderophore-interacting protein [Halarcobacter anaerophilus]